MRPRLPLRVWAMLILALVLTVSILIAVAVVALGVLVFLIPIIAILAVLYYLFPSLFWGRRKPRGTMIIDGEFRAI